MILHSLELLPVVVNIMFAMLGVGLVLAFIRLVQGPSLPSRVVALDLIATLVVGIIVVYAIASNEPIFLQAAIVLALLSFLGTVAFAYYIEKGGKL